MGRYKLFLLLMIALLLLMSLSGKTTHALRGTVVAAFAPVWSGIQKIKESSNQSSESTVALLKLENLYLREEIERLQDLLNQEYMIEGELLQTQHLSDQFFNKEAFFLRRYEELGHLVQLQVQAIPAQVVFRGISTWNSSLWVNVGSEDNEKLGRAVIAKNSPVTLGVSLVGIVDYVGKHQSRVRLITDSGLIPSVRAARGYVQNQYLNQHIEAIKASLEVREDLFSNSKDRETLINHLTALKQNIHQSSEKWMLAKGELHGRSKPLWRSSGQLLRGIGFNYDFSDDEGPARDLRSGKTSAASNQPAVPLLKVNDLLVTTGMDGLFPPGLHVAEIVRIDLLKEGSYAYELEAKPTAGNLDHLSTVFILPSLNFELQEY